MRYNLNLKSMWLEITLLNFPNKGLLFNPNTEISFPWMVSGHLVGITGDCSTNILRSSHARPSFQEQPGYSSCMGRLARGSRSSVFPGHRQDWSTRRWSVTRDRGHMAIDPSSRRDPGHKDVFQWTHLKGKWEALQVSALAVSCCWKTMMKWLHVYSKVIN